MRNVPPPPHATDGTGGPAGDPLEAGLRDLRTFVTATPAPDLEAAVMQRIRTDDPVGREVGWRSGSLRRLLQALWSPRPVTVRLRPAYALLVLVAAAGLLLLQPRTPAPAGSQGGAAEAQFFIQFRLHADEATDVRLAGTFTGWDPHVTLEETSPGVWSILLPLSPGVHDYAFMIDGERWVADPHAPRVADGFGGLNSRLTLLAPNGGPVS
jgi:hypothetical protein